MVTFPWLVVVLIAVTSVTAEECRGNYTLDGAWYSDSDFTYCTTIDGNIDLGESWWKELSLPNAVNITGTITIRDLGPPGRCCHSWTEGISAPVLEHLGGLVIDNTTSGSVTMPELKTVGAISIVLPDCSWSDLEFPKLVEAGSIEIGRSFSSLRLDSLQNVADSLIINYLAGNNEDTGCSYPDSLPMNLPALESAGSLRLEGLLANISLPQLTSVGPPASPGSESGAESGLRLGLDNSTDVHLPKLEVVDGHIHIAGKIKSLSLPVLLNTTAPITIDPSENLVFDMPLVNASTIDLRGYIEAANFTNLQHYASISVTSKADFDCEAFERELNQTRRLHPENGNGTVTCSSTPPKKVNLRQKLGLGLGLAVPLSIIAAAIVFFLVRRNAVSKKRKAVDAALDGTELPTVLPADRQGWREAQGADPGGRTGSRPGLRPETPPPPYSAT
ncbi:hypothetical protein BDV06DRAFT_222652 [Aspergillus oleicola]